MKKTVYLAGGCFWGAEHFLKMIDGVLETTVGYANSRQASPSYQEVCSGDTDAAECVEVRYDPERVPLNDLLGLFFKIIDPTSIDRQGEDRGRQYRTGIYYTDPADETVIRDALERLSHDYTAPIAIETMPLQNFYNAEEYHQDYLVKNPGGYCHVPQGKFMIAKRYRNHAPESSAAPDILPFADRPAEEANNLAE